MHILEDKIQFLTVSRPIRALQILRVQTKNTCVWSFPKDAYVTGTMTFISIRNIGFILQGGVNPHTLI